jgi:hypothetical protein
VPQTAGFRLPAAAVLSDLSIAGQTIKWRNGLIVAI